MTAKAAVILEGLGGELDRLQVEAPHGDLLPEAIRDAIAGSDWFLEPGDIIRIVGVEP